MKLPFSTEIERVFLATLIAHPETIAEYRNYLSEDLCHNDIHRIIINGIINLFDDKKSVDVVRLCSYISNIGLSDRDDVDVVDYISVIAKKSPVKPGKINDYFKDVYKYYIARKVFSACNDTTQEVASNINSDVATIVSIAEKNLSKCVTAAVEDEYLPVDLYESIAEQIEDFAKNNGSFGIDTPWPTWNRWWGPLTVGDLTVVAAPAKNGKSTFLSEIVETPFLPANRGKNVKILFLDTELETFRVQSRKVSAMTDINEFFIKSGDWKNNPEMKEKVQSALRTLESRKGIVKHMYVANMPIDKISSIIRRWAILDTDPDDMRIVIYDYLKLTGEKKDNSHTEWQILGDKCDALKHLCSEVKACGIAAIQTNQQYDVAASQRIKWFASNILLLKKKDPEELSEHGPKFGTHILKPFEMRNHGPDWVEEEYVKTASQDGILYQKNFLNLKIHNFCITECGTFADIQKEDRDDLDIGEEEEKRLRLEKEVL